eukprot:774894-Rhodomonas_salina.4
MHPSVPFTAPWSEQNEVAVLPALSLSRRALACVGVLRVHGCACEVHGCAWMWVCMDVGVHGCGCALVCMGVHGCAWVCTGVHGCAWVCLRVMRLLPTSPPRHPRY